ncbi:hypothetical protein, partial [Eubacterium aggregans]|uniref:hypothetical protein n=1 Tax=Eubacterium aggregans TaxID=81409 RepID=UPI003F3A912A
AYINTTIVHQPTVLHAYIRFLEQYYQADGKPLQVPGAGLTTSGKPTSLFMTKFFGHGANLNYYVNNMYPLMKAGWGASEDYVLVNDQDSIDIVLYSNSMAFLITNLCTLRK